MCNANHCPTFLQDTLRIILRCSCVNIPGHKPRWLGTGILILGFGASLYALPHFTAGLYSFQSSREHNICHPKVGLCFVNIFGIKISRASRLMRSKHMTESLFHYCVPDLKRFYQFQNYSSSVKIFIDCYVRELQSNHPVDLSNASNSCANMDNALLPEGLNHYKYAFIFAMVFIGTCV